LSTIEDKVKALNSYRVLHVSMPLELFDLIKQAGHLGDDLWANLLFIKELEAEGWIPKKDVSKP
jgi:hypothetical protein